MINIESIETFLYRCPIEIPVQTSFGLMTNRPMLLVRIRDQDGVIGWGEVWCNFPSVGAEYRAQLIDHVLGTLLLGKIFKTPLDLFSKLQEQTHILAIQSGDKGAFANCIAGIDIAVHDLMACKQGVSVAKYLGSNATNVPVYASGICADKPEEIVTRLLEEGYDTFKLKVGFKAANDLKNIHALHKILGSDATLAIDVNQAWKLDTAITILGNMEDVPLAWVEEPMAADRPHAEWQTLKETTSKLFSAGENKGSYAEFEQVIAKKYLTIIQPDIAKWGGFSGILAVARQAMAAGMRYFPHYLGGGVGLIASAHLLAATGGDGLLEVDTNPNPLRNDFLDGLLDNPKLGFQITDAPGLGLTLDLLAFDKFKVHTYQQKAKDN